MYFNVLNVWRLGFKVHCTSTRSVREELLKCRFAISAAAQVKAFSFHHTDRTVYNSELQSSSPHSTVQTAYRLHVVRPHDIPFRRVCALNCTLLPYRPSDGLHASAEWRDD